MRNNDIVGRRLYGRVLSACPVIRAVDKWQFNLKVTLRVDI